MTKSNFKQHLEWLVCSKATAPSISLLSALVQAAQTVCTPSQASPPEAQALIHIGANVVNNRRDVQHSGTNTELGPPVLPDTVTSDREGMARLHLNTRAGQGHQLLSKLSPEVDLKDSHTSLGRRSERPRSSSSTVETFGQPQALWREDFAKRIEPRATQGRKRKSGELGEKCMTIRLEASPSALSQESFLALEDLEEEPKKKPRIDLAEDSQLLDCLLFESDLSSAKDEYQLPNVPQSAGCKQSERNKRPLPSSQPVLPATQTPKPKRPASSWSPEKSSKKVREIIEDSEEEDLVSQLPEQGRTVIKQSSPVKPEESPQRLEYPKLQTAPVRPNRNITQSHDLPSLKQTVDSELRIERTASAHPALPGKTNQDSSLAMPTASIEPRAVRSGDGAVDVFLGCKVPEIQSYMQKLAADRERLAKRSYDIVLGLIKDPAFGFEAAKENSAKMGSQISVFEELLALRDGYETTLERKAEIGRRLKVAIDSEDAELEEELGAARQAANGRMSLVKDQIALLLSRTALNNREGLTGLMSAGQSYDQGFAPGSPSVMVRSTQIDAHDTGPRLELDIRGIDGKPPESFQKATVVPSNEISPDTKTRSKETRQTPSKPTAFLGREQLEPTRISIPASPPSFMPRADLSEQNATTNDPVNAIYEDKASHIMMPNQRYKMTYQENEEDFFGEDVDYDEMIQAADDFEQQPEVNTLGPRSVPARVPLSETTGNSMRPPPQPSKAHQPLLIDLKHPDMQHRWSRDVLNALKKRFHLHGFRPNQLAAINTTLSGKDAFVLMPTGGGKSLCYQLPAIVNSGKTQGVTIVISPLLSLMQDQVEHLHALRIQATLLNGETSTEQKRLIRETLRGDDPEKFIQLLYITPEMLAKNQAMVDLLIGLHRRQKLARIVIDEAHCVSQWGHDFRPDYKQLGEVRLQFPGAPVMALTATATENVKLDVIHNLKMSNYQVYTSSFNRPNLVYEIRKKTRDMVSTIGEIIQEYDGGQSGIVYCLSRKNCELLAETLRKKFRIRAHHYHAGMAAEERMQVQKAWQAGTYQVIVATIAFGMGIDKADVRFVIHQTIPKSLEGYYQETGRAGRDGRMSKCVLFFGYGDLSKLQRMIDEGEGSPEQKERQHRMLRAIVQFCENRATCRRVQVLNYFGEAFDAADCSKTCDNCISTAEFETRDLTEAARQAIQLVRSLADDEVTLLYCVDVFRGARNKKMANKHHDRSPYFGVATNLGMSRSDTETLFFKLLAEQILQDVTTHNAGGFPLQHVQLGPKAHAFEQSRRTLQLDVTISPAGNSKAAKKPRKRGTGVAGAQNEEIQSTYVSTPSVPKKIREKQPQRKGKEVSRANEPQASSDSFVVNDDHVDYESDHSVNAAFEPLRVAGKPSPRKKKRELGPPITTDQRMDSLDPLHRQVVDEFVHHAEAKAKSLMLQKGRKYPPFTIQALREMAISFPKNSKELAAIPGVRQEALPDCANSILRLIRSTEQHYKEMVDEGDRPHDPNKRTAQVIDISSDEEGDHEFGGDDSIFNDYATGGDENLDSSPGGERSSYFGESDDVRRFNEMMSQASMLAPSQHSQPQANSVSSSRAGRGGRGFYRAKGGSSGVRRGSGGYRKRGASAAASRGGGSAARGGSSSWRNVSASRRGAWGMGMMPT